MTIHSSKGLEFDYVFLPFWVDGKMPVMLMNEEIDIEEERRTAFVGITRARKQAFISFHLFKEDFSGIL